MNPNIFIFTHDLNIKIQTDPFNLINGLSVSKIIRNSKALNDQQKLIENLSIYLYR